MRRAPLASLLAVGTLWGMGAALTGNLVSPGRATEAPPPGPAHQMYGNLVFTDCPQESKAPAKGHTGHVLVLVNAGVYPDIKGAVAVYVNDLVSEGYKVTTRTVEEKKGQPIVGRPYWYLKAGIRDWWHSSAADVGAQSTIDHLLGFFCRTGVVLVGDLPYPEVHMRQGEWTDEKGGKHPYEGVGPLDIFLTDMDGPWTAVDPSFNTFISTCDSVPPPDSECLPADANVPPWVPAASAKLGKAGARPELFLGRVNARHVSQGSKAREVALLKDYFARNHAYRTTPAPTVALPAPTPDKHPTTIAWPRLVYIDDDWSGWGPRVGKSLQAAWGGPLVADAAVGGQGETRYVSSGQLTTKADYEQRVASGQHLWVDLLSHANPWDHYFVTASGGDWLSSDEVKGFGPKSHFYFLQGCSACDYRQDGNLGETYLFLGPALGVIGHTGAGPVDSAQFYVNVGQGLSLGETVMLAQQMHGRAKTWPTNMASPADGVDPKRYYNVTLLGDPTLRAPHPVATLAPLPPGTVVLKNHLAELTKVAGAKSPQELAVKLRTASQARARTDEPGKLTVVRSVAVAGADVTSYQRHQPAIDPFWRHYTNKGVERKLHPVVRDFGFKLTDPRR